ncbi:cell division protein ZipA C-terminal FtsZ-binding domain-containing protein [Ottowia sp.]|uniref:cell division protein ZipA C-terminal FtsZ-binding domain-containing protein n=1 Tax=Ottowia sp. TaxID=1898956 RepID=UPI002C4782A3|nr:cell division protein ZipA C-terminal FtsZ-binding domain-containing protein [Ottowia sp.]MCP5257863.1 cell division protein FtsZ [Burkholderiaceae bacterium]HRW70838.1 cell division protein ZipA C-terminal FtsZ-binding domain-containing protein [Ottowia sp.]
MSALQVGLAVAGGLLLGGVIAWETWNARRRAPRQPVPERRPPAPEEGERVEPGVASALPTADDERLEPGFDTAPGALSPLGPVPAPEKRPRLDALIDVIAPIALDGRVVSGDAALAALPATRRVGSKPFAVEGRNVLTEEWEFPIAGQRYDALQAGVQLANRTGPLNEIEYSEYVMKAQHFADALGGAPEFPDMLHEVARARELDEFAATHDAQLSFTLRARLTAWSPGFVHQQAARLGFTAGAIPGRMVLPAEEPGLPPVLGLVFDPRAALSEDPEQSAINSLALSLDVPQVHRNARPFGRLRDVAFALAEVMDGEITDDTGQPLRTEMIDKIGQDLAQLYDTLDAHDLAAGSPQARRLFS